MKLLPHCCYHPRPHRTRCSRCSRSRYRNRDRPCYYGGDDGDGGAYDDGCR